MFQLMRGAAGDPQPQPQGKTPAAGAMERFGIGEPAEQSGRFMFRGAAEIGEQRRAQQRPPEAVDSYTIAGDRKRGGGGRSGAERCVPGGRGNIKTNKETQ